MSAPKPPQPAKLIVSVFMNQSDLLESAFRNLVQAFGPIDTISPWMSFNYTDYYSPEMGAPLHRRMLAFKEPIQQRQLPEIKIRTNGIERTHRSARGRAINIDPGYLLLERFVLATGKNFAHRIYLDQGIYADLTLVYRGGAFQSLPWTYPDYADPQMHRFLNQVRQKYRFDLNKLKPIQEEVSP